MPDFFRFRSRKPAFTAAPPSVHPVVRDVQHRPAGLAADSVVVVASQAAGRAGEMRLGGPQHDLDRSQEPADPEIMIATGSSFPALPARVMPPNPVVESVVTGKVERVDAVHDLVVHFRSGLIDRRGHREDEDQQVEPGAKGGLMPPEDGDDVAKLVQGRWRMEDPEKRWSRSRSIRFGLNVTQDGQYALK